MTNFKYLLLIHILWNLSFACGELNAQCNTKIEYLQSEFITMVVEGNHESTRIRFIFDSNSIPDSEIVGFNLGLTWSSSESLIDHLDYDLSGAWIFDTESKVSDVEYDNISNEIRFYAQRLDCVGRIGAGLIGELIIHHSPLGLGRIRLSEGGIILLDNIDAG